MTFDSWFTDLIKTLNVNMHESWIFNVGIKNLDKKCILIIQSIVARLKTINLGRCLKNIKYYNSTTYRI